MAWWHWLIHVAGIDYGLPYGTWSWYNAYSGIGGALPDVLMVTGLVAWYWHRTCHRRRCWRPGRHDFTDQATGLTWRLCARDHPDHPGHPLTVHHIARIHERNRAGEP